VTDRKVILVGLDGATWDLIEPWADAGKLPAFSKLMQQGVWGELESTTPPISPSAWTSIYTGVNPGKHGITNFFKTRKNSYLYQPISSGDRKARAIWQILSDYGRKSIIINTPFTYPPDAIAGIMITGFGTPSLRSNFVYPERYKERLLNKFPHFAGDFGDEALILGERRKVIVKTKEIFDSQIEVARHLLNSEPYELCVVVFRAHEPLQHFFWEDKDLLLTFYQEVDSFLKYLIDDIMDENSTLIMVSDHGFQRVESYIRVNNWLEQLGLFKINKSFKGNLAILEKLSGIIVKLGLDGLVREVFRGGLAGRIMSIIPSSSFGYLSDVDWHNTKAFYVDGSEGLIRINLKGRETQGAVDSDEYENVRELITGELYNLADSNTKRKVISAVFRKEDIFSGELHDVPDIVLIPERGYCLSGQYDYSGKIFDYQRAQERRGEHDRRGIFLSYGHEVNKGKITGARVHDVAPTILDMLGLPVPEFMDGRVLGILSGGKQANSRLDSGLQVSERERIKQAIRELKNTGNI